MPSYKLSLKAAEIGKVYEDAYSDPKKLDKIVLAKLKSVIGATAVDSSIVAGGKGVTFTITAPEGADMVTAKKALK